MSWKEVSRLPTISFGLLAAMSASADDPETAETLYRASKWAPAKDAYQRAVVPDNAVVNSGSVTPAAQNRIQLIAGRPYKTFEAVARIQLEKRYAAVERASRAWGEKSHRSFNFRSRPASQTGCR